MPSLLPGFEYDVFISYRQKDNKGDRWVTKFVDTLRAELESTFKDDVSIYFDENISDGLLETHNVDKSIERKLKCIVFIPIISQTYCDPKSFAWQNEFRAFNQTAKQDSFGRDIRLGNGNVASRILPVHIHNLDEEDLQSLEKELGGVLRAVEFIYREPGVNRPLSADDDLTENLNKTRYRNQVNKVANAIKELVTSMKSPGKASSGTHERKDAQSKEKSIVVLPFEDMSPEKDQEYFCDGLAEELINVLSKIKDIHVVARTSAFSFKGKETDTKKIGRKLNVGFLLEGGVRKSGSKLRITTQLVGVADGFPIWSERYDRDLVDVFAIQDEISLQIVNALKLRIGSEAELVITRRDTRDFDAYNSYVMGNYYKNKLTEEGLTKGLLHYEEALKTDPRYAKAYAGIAEGYFFLGWYYYAPLKEAAIRAKQATLQALAIDDSLSKAHTTLGWVYMIDDRNWAGAKKEFETATDLDPNDATARSFHSIYLSATARHQESIAEAKRAQKLDPLTPFTSINVAMRHYYARQFDAAIDEIRQVQEMDPNFSMANYYLAWPYAQKGMLREALESVTKAQTILGSTMPILSCLGVIYALMGKKEKASAVLNDLTAQPTQRSVPFFFIAEIYVVLNQIDQAFQWLEKAYEEHDRLLVYLQVDPLLDPIRRDQRFTTLLNKIGLSSGDHDVSPAGPAEKSIVVLPFHNMSPDKDNEYFSDGLTEEIITDLSRVKDLLVISRSSAMTFKESKKTTKAIAEEVNVRYVLEGSVRKVGNNLRVTAQLIDGTTDAHLWAEKYSGTLENVFEIQEKLSSSIVTALIGHLGPEDLRAISRQPITDVGSYELYLRSRKEMAMASLDELRKAQAHVKEALRVTGDNELLLGTLVTINYLLWFHGFTGSGKEHELEIAGCKEKVLLLNPHSIHGYFASALLHYMRNERQEASAYFKKTLAINQSHLEAMQILGQLYLDVGRPEAADPLLRKLLDLDPVSAFNQSSVGYLEWQQGRFQIALPYWKKMYELAPLVPGGAWSYACALASAGKKQESINLIESFPPDVASTHFGTMARLLKCALTGDTVSVDALLTPAFVSFAKSLIFISRDLAGYFGMLGRMDEGLNWLNNAIALGYINYPFLALHHPFYGPLRTHHGFNALMERIRPAWEAFEV